MPPGTGDVALSLSQTVPVAGAVLVTTPQTVSLADTKRAVLMYRKLNIPAIGLVENMSYFVCPRLRDRKRHLRQGRRRAPGDGLSVPFLGRIPIDEPVRRGGDTGVPIVIGSPESAPARALFALAERVAQQVSIASYSRRAIPLTPVSMHPPPSRHDPDEASGRRP